MALRSIIGQTFDGGTLLLSTQLIRTLAALLLIMVPAQSHALCPRFLQLPDPRGQAESEGAIPEDFEVSTEGIPEAELDQLLNRIREKAAGEVASAVSKVKSPDLQGLAQALQAERHQTSRVPTNTQASTLEELDDMDGDLVPELVFRWSRSERFPLQDTEVAGLLPDWTLFFLSWNGVEWGASWLMEGDGLYEVHVLPNLGSGKSLAVVEGITLAPFPVIFQIQDHVATLVWDAHADDSRYQGFSGGEVDFHEVQGVDEPVMVASGKADPGFLFFRRDSRRGFMATTVYVWNGRGYIPRHTGYTLNEDYTLYRFISALHLHDFRSAYALIDPPKFLNSDEPNLELFEQYIGDSLPEFLGNNIFEARDAAEDHSFRVTVGGERYVYFPTFSDEPKFLLTGLVRQHE